MKTGLNDLRITKTEIKNEELYDDLEDREKLEAEYGSIKLED